METIKEEKKAEWEKELVYKPIYLPVRFFKKEAYIHIDDYKEAINKRKNAVNGLEEENRKLKDELLKVKDEYSDLWEKYLEMRDYVNKAYLVTLK